MLGNCDGVRRPCDYARSPHVCNRWFKMKNQTPFFLAISAFLLALGVALGAFGAHALEGFLDAGRLETWETSVQHHVWNSLGVMAIVLISRVFGMDLKIPVYLIFAGILVFSGSLYLLCLGDIPWLGAITPIGGLCLIAGWSLCGVLILRSKP